jgi:hypothetical protein
MYKLIITQNETELVEKDGEFFLRKDGVIFSSKNKKKIAIAKFLIKALREKAGV